MIEEGIEHGLPCPHTVGVFYFIVSHAFYSPLLSLINSTTSLRLACLFKMTLAFAPYFVPDLGEQQGHENPPAPITA